MATASLPRTDASTSSRSRFDSVPIPAHQRFHVIRKSNKNKLEAPALFLSSNDCHGYLERQQQQEIGDGDENGKQQGEDFQQFADWKDAMAILMKFICQPENKMKESLEQPQQQQFVEPSDNQEATRQQQQLQEQEQRKRPPPASKFSHLHKYRATRANDEDWICI